MKEKYILVCHDFYIKWVNGVALGKYTTPEMLGPCRCVKNNERIKTSLLNSVKWNGENFALSMTLLQAHTVQDAYMEMLAFFFLWGTISIDIKGFEMSSDLA